MTRISAKTVVLAFVVLVTAVVFALMALTSADGAHSGAPSGHDMSGMSEHGHDMTGR